MTTELILLCIVAFSAGFIDAIAGGGGLIQTPAALVLLSQYPVATVIGTLKIPAFTGTSVATLQYATRVKVNWKNFLWMGLTAFLSATAGSYVLQRMHNDFMKPVILLVLIVVVIYTFLNEDFGIHKVKNHRGKQELLYGSLFALVIGFYDGFIGPGAGSFLILAFVSILGFDFLKASAYAKLVNLSTNLGSAIFFGMQGLIIFKIAIPMACCNALGALLGARLAILKGNKFVRIFFLIVIVGIILRFAFDIVK